MKSDNIFRYYDLQKYKRLEEEILAGDYINGDEVRKNENSYYRYALKRYEEFLSDLRYEDVLAEFNRLKQAGQIEFVTFHQSYSYEEFVEGIRPCVSWEGKANEVRYEGKKEFSGKFARMPERQAAPENKYGEEYRRRGFFPHARI